MAWNALVDRILAGSKKRKELEVENQSEYDQWVSEVDSEIEVFVKRVNRLDLGTADGRSKFYGFIGRFSTRLRELRERSESSGASAEALIQLEELIEEMNSSASDVSVSVAYLGDDPVEKARRERKRKKRRQEKAEKAREKRDEIANHIHDVTSALENKDS